MLSSLDVIRQIIHLLNGVRLEQILIIKVVKEYVQTLLGINNVRLILRWCLGLDTLEFCAKDFVDGTGAIWNV